MKLTVSRNAWHYRFLRAMRFLPADDICGYVQQLMLATALAMAAAGIAFVVLYAYGDFFAWLAVGLYLAWVEPNAVFGFVAFTWVLGALVAGFMFYGHRGPPLPPEFVRAAWNSVAHKICVPLEFK